MEAGSQKSLVKGRYVLIVLFAIFVIVPLAIFTHSKIATSRLAQRLVETAKTTPQLKYYIDSLFELAQLKDQGKITKCLSEKDKLAVELRFDSLVNNLNLNNFETSSCHDSFGDIEEICNESNTLRDVDDFFLQMKTKIDRVSKEIYLTRSGRDRMEHLARLAAANEKFFTDSRSIYEEMKTDAANCANIIIQNNNSLSIPIESLSSNLKQTQTWYKVFEFLAYKTNHYYMVDPSFIQEVVRQLASKAHPDPKALDVIYNEMGILLGMLRPRGENAMWKHNYKWDKGQLHRTDSAIKACFEGLF